MRGGASVYQSRYVTSGGEARPDMWLLAWRRDQICDLWRGYVKICEFWHIRGIFLHLTVVSSFKVWSINRIKYNCFLSRDVSNNALYLPTRICLFIVKWNISRLVTLQLMSRSDLNGTMDILWICVVLLDTLYGYVIFRVLATCYPSIIRLLVSLDVNGLKRNIGIIHLCHQWHNNLDQWCHCLSRGVEIVSLLIRERSMAMICCFDNPEVYKYNGISLYLKSDRNSGMNKWHEILSSCMH